jgi:hypothetical protein
MSGLVSFFSQSNSPSQLSAPDIIKYVPDNTLLNTLSSLDPSLANIAMVNQVEDVIANVNLPVGVLSAEEKNQIKKGEQVVRDIPLPPAPIIIPSTATIKEVTELVPERIKKAYTLSYAANKQTEKILEYIFQFDDLNEHGGTKDFGGISALQAEVDRKVRELVNAPEQEVRKLEDNPPEKALGIGNPDGYFNAIVSLVGYETDPVSGDVVGDGFIPSSLNAFKHTVLDNGILSGATSKDPFERAIHQVSEVAYLVTDDMKDSIVKLATGAEPTKSGIDTLNSCIRHLNFQALGIERLERCKSALVNFIVADQITNGSESVLAKRGLDSSSQSSIFSELGLDSTGLLNGKKISEMEKEARSTFIDNVVDRLAPYTPSNQIKLFGDVVKSSEAKQFLRDVISLNKGKYRDINDEEIDDRIDLLSANLDIFMKGAGIKKLTKTIPNRRDIAIDNIARAYIHEAAIAKQYKTIPDAKTVKPRDQEIRIGSSFSYWSRDVTDFTLSDFTVYQYAKMCNDILSTCIQVMTTANMIGVSIAGIAGLSALVWKKYLTQDQAVDIVKSTGKGILKGSEVAGDVIGGATGAAIGGTLGLATGGPIGGAAGALGGMRIGRGWGKTIGRAAMGATIGGLPVAAAAVASELASGKISGGKNKRMRSIIGEGYENDINEEEDEEDEEDKEEETTEEEVRRIKKNVEQKIYEKGNELIEALKGKLRELYKDISFDDEYEDNNTEEDMRMEQDEPEPLTTRAEALSAIIKSKPEKTAEDVALEILLDEKIKNDKDKMEEEEEEEEKKREVVLFDEESGKYFYFDKETNKLRPLTVVSDPPPPKKTTSPLSIKKSKFKKSLKPQRNRKRVRFTSKMPQPQPNPQPPTPQPQPQSQIQIQQPPPQPQPQPQEPRPQIQLPEVLQTVRPQIQLPEVLQTVRPQRVTRSSAKTDNMSHTSLPNTKRRKTNKKK